MDKIDGFIDRITLPNGKTYGLKCEIVEIYSMTCPKCGGSLELKYGSGKCPYCDTYFSTEFKLQEVKK